MSVVTRLLALSCSLAFLAPAVTARALPDCEASTSDGETLALFLDAPLPGSMTVAYEPDCPLEVDVLGSAAVGLPLFDFYLTIDASGSSADCSGADIDEDGDVGVDIGFLGCSDPDDSILAAEVRAFRDFVATLSADRSRVAIIVFSNLPPGAPTGPRMRIVQSLTSDFALVNAGLDDVLAGGSGGATDYSAAILLVRQEAATNGDRADRRQIAYFVSDGLPTFPVDPGNVEDPGDSEAALDEADLAASDELVINTFGIGFIPRVTRDPVLPPRCDRFDPATGGLVTTSTLECIALRTGGGFFASNDPEEILERLLQTRPAGVESVVIFNDTIGTAVVGELTTDGGYRGSVPVLLGEHNALRAVATATDGTECEVETDFLPLCFEATCDPRTQGYWHRQCSGLGLGERRGGAGPSRHLDWEEEILRRLLAVIVDPIVADLGSDIDPTTCDGLAAEPRRDPCQRAIKQYSALMMNLLGGRLAPDCSVDLGEGLPSTAGEAADFIADLIRRGLAGDAEACKLASDLADLINTGRALD